MKDDIKELPFEILSNTVDVVSVQIVLVNLLQLVFFFIDYEDYGIVNERHWYITFAPWLFYYGTLFLASNINAFFKILFKNITINKDDSL